MKGKTIAAAVVITACAAITVLAQGPGPLGRGRGPGGPGGPGPNILGMIRQLDLSDTQREQLRQIMEEGRHAGDVGAGVRAERRLHEALLADSPDGGSLETLRRRSMQLMRPSWIAALPSSRRSPRSLHRRNVSSC
jgi:Spy/CpxP family protein refolding chaperone